MSLHVNCWDEYHRAQTIAKHKVAIDVGANDGGYTHTLRKAGFKVHAFEPVPEMFNKMRERFTGDRGVICNNVGLSDVAETIPDVAVLSAWTIAPVGTGGLQKAGAYKDAPTFTMRTTTLDAYIGNTPVGLIKLDVDGYEPMVLRGARQTIARWRPPILCEFSLYVELLGTPAKCFINQIFDIGYVIKSMDGKTTCTTWEQVKPEYPYNTSFDVMLWPKEIGEVSGQP